MFSQASLIKDCDRFDMTHAPPDLLRIARAYQAANEIRVGDGYVELAVPMADFRVMRVLLRLCTDRSVVVLSADAKYFSCLKTDAFQDDRSRAILTEGSVDWLDCNPRLELRVDTTTAGFTRVIEETLEALRKHWTVPVGRA